MRPRNRLETKVMLLDLVNLRLENASLTPFGERVTPAVQRYHVEPDGQADGQSLWLLQLPCGHTYEYSNYLRMYIRVLRRNNSNEELRTTPILPTVPTHCLYRYIPTGSCVLPLTDCGGRRVVVEIRHRPKQLTS